MINANLVKYVVGLAPISLNSAAATALSADTAGYNYWTCIVQLGVVGGAATVLRITEDTVSTGGTPTAIGGNYTSVGTTGDGRLPQTADAGKIFIFSGPCGGPRKRYLYCELTTGATTLASVTWVLSRANQSPNTDTERNVASYIDG